MEKALPRYKREVPPEELPAAATSPELGICQMIDNRLVLPRDVRQQFLSCPIFGAEWRTLLQQFDRDWGVGNDELSTPPPRNRQNPDSTPLNPSPPATSAFMAGEPENKDKVVEKYGEVVAELPLPDTACSLLVMPGPVLFVAAKEACTLRPHDGPLILHGAGSWLTGEKADKYEHDNPKKGVPCLFANDLAKVVLLEEPSV